MHIMLTIITLRASDIWSYQTAFSFTKCGTLWNASDKK